MNRRTKLGIARDKKIKSLHGGKRVSVDGNVYYEYRENRSDFNRTKKFGKGGDLWTPLDFTSIEEYFDYINDSLINGNRTQVASLYRDMDDSQKKQFFDYAEMQGESFDDIIDYINNKVRTYAKGGGVGKVTKYIVFYSQDGGMRERVFENEDEANTFSNKVSGSVSPIKLAKGGEAGDSHLDDLYRKSKNNVQGALELYAGELGIYNMFYGHKVDASKKAKYKKAQKYLESKYMAKGGGIGNEPLNENMRAVISRLHKLKVDSDLVSPNYVADIANGMGINLKSEEVVRISDGFGDKYAKGSAVGNKTFDSLYRKIVNAVMKDINISREKAEDIVDENKVWLTDMIESQDETNVTFLADQITTNDEGKYDKGGELSRQELLEHYDNYVNNLSDDEEPISFELWKQEYADDLNTIMDDEEFIVHGHYTVSNSGGYEIMLSDDGEAARVRDAFGSDNPETSDWLDIEYVIDEEGEPDEDGNLPSEPVIDPEGYNIPLNLVMRSNFKKGGSVKQKGAQYKIDGYGSGDRKHKAKPVGFRYERIRDPKTGKLRVVTKDDKKYYATPTKKEIKAYKDGDATAKKMLGFELRKDHSDREPLRTMRKFAAGGSVTIGEYKATFKVKYSLDGDKQKDGYIVSVLTPSQKDIDYYLLYDKSKKLVKKISHQEGQQLVKDKKITLVKRYDVENEKQKSDPNTPVKEMGYAERREWINENIVPHLKSAVNYWNSYNHGSFDANDEKSNKEFLDKVRKSAMYGSTEAFEKATSLKVDDSGWGLESPEGEEFEEVASDNTYNSSYLGLFNWSFKIYSIYGERFVLMAHPHMGGDIRSNYGDPIFLEGESKEDVIYKFYEEVIDGKHSVNLEFKDGTSVTFDAQQDSDVNYYELYDDGSKKKKLKLGSPVEVLISTFKTFKGWSGDDFVESIVDEFNRSKPKKKKDGGNLGSYLHEDKNFNEYKKSLEDKYGKGFKNTSLNEDEFDKLYELKERRNNSFEKNIQIENAHSNKLKNGGDMYSDGGSLKGTSESDLEETAEYMAKAVKKRADLKDLIVYFEKDNNFDYKVRAKIWDDMNVWEMPKTYNNILKVLKEIVKGNKELGVNDGKYADGGTVDVFGIGDLVFNKTLGSRGLVGLVISEGKYNDEYEVTEYDVLYRGYSGDVIATDESDIVDITEGYIDFAENNGDLSAYSSISKKHGITLNSKYQDAIDENSDEEEFAKGGKVTNVTKNILKEYVFEYHYPKYKRQPETTQKYKVDISKVIPIGGMGEDGFKLITLDGNDTGVVITLVNALQAIRKGEIEFEQSKDYFVKVKAIKNNEYADGGTVDVFGIGDLVFNKTLGSRGLVGLVISEGKYNDEYEVTEYDVLYRGYSGDVIATDESDIVDITEGYIDFAENNGDLSAYSSISKKHGITLNSKYQDAIDENSDEEEFAKGGELPSSMTGKSLSSGTLKSEHLIESFMDFLQSVKVELGIEEKVNNLQEEVNALEKDEDGDFVGESQETATYILNEDIFDLLNNIAPEGTSFGSHEGNGSDFGFWEYENEEEFAKGGGVSDTKKIKKRLEYLRKELRAERISQGELIELESLAKYIDKGDVELLEAAGVPEFEDDDEVEEEKFRYKDIYSSQGGMTFETGEEVEEFIKRTKPFIRKELKKGNFVVVYNGKEYFIGEKLKINDEYADGGGVGESILIKNIIGKYEKKYGYKPSKQELNNLYSSGQLSLTDEEENELIKYFNEYADGGSLKKTKEKYVELLNEIGVPEYDHPEHGGRVPYKYLDKYGVWLRKNDPIAFRVGYSDWTSGDDYKKGGSVGSFSLKKNRKDEWINDSGQYLIVDMGDEYQAFDLHQEHNPEDNVIASDEDFDALVEKVFEYNGENYKRGGRIKSMKQKPAQYERDIPYGGRDSAVKSKPVGYRYMRIIDKKSGKLRKAEKTDTEYYLTPTKKLIAAYEAGDAKVKKMLYFENRADHSDKKPNSKRGY